MYNVKISYQGEMGAYGYTVAKRFGMPMGALTFKAALNMVKLGDADQAVIPVENSYYGEVADSNDAIYSAGTGLHIIGEWYEPIRHCLIGNSGDLNDIKQVYSHPQALGQCKRFLEKHNLLQTLHYDTAASVSMVKRTGDKSIAAIASRDAAKLHNMKIIMEGINDNKDNTTRFLIIGRDPVPYKQDVKYKTTIAFTLHHNKGSLYAILDLMRDVNLTRITSRPISGWKYVFFVDYEGHTQQHKVMMDAIRERCLVLDVFGSYKQGFS